MADIRIGKASGVSGPSSAKKAKKVSTGSSSFSDALRETAESALAPATGGVSGVSSIGGILAVQEVPDSTDGRSRGLVIDYGDELLDRLEDIRIGLLLGTMSKDKLAELAQQMRQKRNEIDDPELKEIIDEIELRSEVEIAKLTRNL